MAGRKSPWGGGGDDPGSDGGRPDDGAPDGSGDSAPRPESAEDRPSSEDKPSSEDRSAPERGRADGPRNPWLSPGGGENPGNGRKPASLEELFRKRLGGNGGGRIPHLPPRADGKSWLPLIVAGAVAVWVMVTAVHSIAPQEKGVVTTFGSYSRTLGPGVSLTLPWPIQQVSVTDVTSIRRESIPDGEGERLMLTGDQNLVDLSYLVRWNIKDLKLYQFQLRDPQQSVRQVGEAAMRATIAEVTLNEAMGTGRAMIESRVRDRMQQVLDAYRSGVTIQGVEIKKTDPPERVVDAFKGVLAAQQDAQSDINRARAFAQQITARAQGEAAAFDKVYAQYKLAPEVTRRRMYYETMERVLSQNDKVIVESGGVTSYLPLPEVRRSQAQQQAQPPAQTPAQPQGDGR